MTERTYSATEVARASGLTYRVLDYWMRCGVITASVEAHGSGSRRRWTQTEFDRLVVLGDAYNQLRQLSPGGVDSDTIAAIWEALQKELPWSFSIVVTADGRVIAANDAFDLLSES